MALVLTAVACAGPPENVPTTTRLPTWPAGQPVLNAEAVLRRELQPRARACYNATLAQDPGFSGKLLLSIRVGADGGVTDVATAALAGPLADCIRAAARRLQFESPGPEGSTFTTSFNFVHR